MQYSRSFARLFAQLFPRHPAHPARRGQRGMTLLEIMIVMAILALVMGLLVGPKVMGYFKQAKIDNTNLKLRLMAYQAYTGWSAAHPSTECPDSLTELAAFMNNDDINDSWGVPLIMACGPNAAPAARGFGVSSAGEDHQVGTADDLHSWTQAATPKS